MTVTQITRLTLLRVMRSLFLIAILAGTLILAPKINAQSYDVTARVDSPLPTSPATITSPADQQHFNTSPITVTGTCDDGTYVALFRNGAFAGTASCTGGFFTLQLALTPGSNVLQAKNYNNTDNEGPASPPITVYYDIPLPEPTPPRSGTSLGLEIISIDGIPYGPYRTYSTSSRPIIQGLAPPYSTITINFGPEDLICRVTADIHGKWSCRLAENLPDGTHLVTVSGVSPQGVVTKLLPFTIFSSHATKSPIASSEGLFILYFPYSYRTYKVNETWQGDISIQGGTPPYITSVDWNDGTIFEYKNNNSNTFTISHAFNKPGNYQPIIYATDQHSNKSSLQLLIPVVGEDSQPGSNSSLITAIIGIVGVIVLASIVTEVCIVASSIFFKSSAPKK